MGTWQLQEARRRFSELVEQALTAGPQRVTRDGKSAVVVVAEDEWRRLRDTKPPLGVLLACFPGAEDDLPIRLCFQSRAASDFGQGAGRAGRRECPELAGFAGIGASAARLSGSRSGFENGA
jgi:prevent-host-death family protein